MAPTGFEPATPGLRVQYSTGLSYEALNNAIEFVLKSYLDNKFSLARGFLFVKEKALTNNSFYVFYIRSFMKRELENIN